MKVSAEVLAAAKRSVAQHRRSFFLTLAVLGFSMLAWAQRERPIQAAAVPATSTTGNSIPQIWVGQSVAALKGPWRFQIGDSPVDPATQRPLWVEPGFDDSRWETMDLSPVPGIADPYNGDPRYVPGWTAKGHPGYMGWAWYRLKVPVAALDGERLALESPIYVDDGFQVFVNGELLGGFGNFDGPGKPPTVSSTAPATFLLPQSAAGSSAGAAPIVQTIAFRVWMGPMGLTHSPYAGGLHYPPMVGTASAIAAQTRLDLFELDAQSAFAPFEGLLLLLLGVLAAGMILFDHSERVYLWIAGVLLFTAMSDGALTAFTLTQFLSLRTYFMFFDVFSNPIQSCGWIMVWWYWFRLDRPAWLPKATAALLLLYMVSKALGGDFFYGAALHPPGVAFNTASVVVRLLFLPLLIFVIGLGIRKQGLEGWLVLPAVVPLAISQFSSELIVLNMPVKWAPFGITIFVSQVSNLISAAAISLLLLRRLLLSVRRQRELALDLKQAQELQSMLNPEAQFDFPGFALTTAYRPALEVGGDFFKITPLEGGGMQILLGDVSGKGLKAAMAVSFILGTLRVLVDECPAPAELLFQLNRRLFGQLQGGFSTCIVIDLEADGRCTLASAGHPAPILNDQELVVAGSLPLGLARDVTYEEKNFELRIGDRLTLYTDGLVEARNSVGELYGFTRLKGLLAARPSARQAADVAREFGQDDDVTVLTLTRVGLSPEAGLRDQVAAALPA